MIEVLHPGIYSSIQDQGRTSFAKFGVPLSGAMDSYSHQIGNILLKNSSKAAAIELTFGGAKLLFHKDTFLCITGADYSPTIDGEAIEMKTVYEVKAGSVLSFGIRKYGLRTYIAVQGGIQTETVLKSKSHALNITTKHRIEKGDMFQYPDAKPYKNLGFSKMKRNDFLFEEDNLSCYPGPEYDLLSDDHKIQLNNVFTISNDSDRVGCRLEELIENKLSPMFTSAVMPGTVQLTPSGKLIVLMRDCQVTGGYPRILQLDNFSISILSQKIAGNPIKFQLKKL